MNLPELLTLAVIFVAAPLSWLVAALLWRLSRTEPTFKTLRAHAVAALALALIVTTFAAVFVNNSLAAPPPLTLVQTQIITRGALLVISTVSAAYWLLFIWRAK